jgi:hypothetical protein
MLIYDIFIILGAVCPSRHLNPVDNAECGTVACMYLEYPIDIFRRLQKNVCDHFNP